MKCPVCGRVMSSHAALSKHLSWWKQLEPRLHEALMCKPLQLPIEPEPSNG